MPGNSESSCAAITCSSGDEAPRRRRAADEPGQQRRAPSPGRSARSPVAGSRTETARLSDRFEMYGERVAGVDRERREHREDPLLEDLDEVLAVVVVEVVPARTISTPAAAERRHEVVEVEVAPAGGSARSTRSPISQQLLAPGVRPSGDGCVDPGRHLVLAGPATRTWKNSSRLVEKMAQNFTRSSSGMLGSSASASTRALKSSQDSSRLRSRGRGRQRSPGRPPFSVPAGRPTGWPRHSCAWARRPLGRAVRRASASPARRSTSSPSGRPRSHSSRMRSRSASRTMRSRLRRNCGIVAREQHEPGQHPGPELLDHLAVTEVAVDLPVRRHRPEVDHTGVPDGRLGGWVGDGHAGPPVGSAGRGYWL